MDVGLGVHASKKYLFFIILSPVGAYGFLDESHEIHAYAEAVDEVHLLLRLLPQGLGHGGAIQCDHDGVRLELALGKGGRRGLERGGQEQQGATQQCGNISGSSRGHRSLFGDS